jgi:hypothetical protein
MSGFNHQTLKPAGLRTIAAPRLPFARLKRDTRERNPAVWVAKTMATGQNPRFHLKRVEGKNETGSRAFPKYAKPAGIRAIALPMYL